MVAYFHPHHLALALTQIYQDTNYEEFGKTNHEEVQLSGIIVKDLQKRNDQIEYVK